MTIWARVDAGAVIETTDIDPAGRFVAAWVWVDCTSTAGVQSGWTYDGTAFHAPAAAPAPTPAQQAATLIATGLAVTSTGTPALSATYPCDPTTQSHIAAEMISVLVNGTFADVTASVQWPDVTGALHTFTLAQWRPLAVAIGAFVAAALKVQIGATTTLPSAAVTIP